jgi:hypothetical protein
MSVRNNEERFGSRVPSGNEAPMPNPMDFVTPKEFVELPSKGKMYPKDHPLHNEETIEIRFMTAKDEDILTSRALLKKGLALDRLIDNLIVDKRIQAGSLVMGDRSAILIKARASAYGHVYETKVNCPACGEPSKHNFDLLDPFIYDGRTWGEYDITATDNGTFKTITPVSKITVEFKILTGDDELKLLKKNSKAKKEVDTYLSDQLKLSIVSVNEFQQDHVIDHVVKSLPALESRWLRNCLKAVSPDVKIVKDCECSSCEHEQELGVPFNTDFFWPDR